MADSTNLGRTLDADETLGRASDDAAEETDERSRMGFLDHLDELRRRIPSVMTWSPPAW
jgi:hypothetical protein